MRCVSPFWKSHPMLSFVVCLTPDVLTVYQIVCGVQKITRYLNIKAMKLTLLLLITCGWAISSETTEWVEINGFMCPQRATMRFKWMNHQPFVEIRTTFQHAAEMSHLTLITENGMRHGTHPVLRLRPQKIHPSQFVIATAIPHIFLTNATLDTVKSIELHSADDPSQVYPCPAKVLKIPIRIQEDDVVTAAVEQPVHF
jgi:hypothetical protein